MRIMIALKRLTSRFPAPVPFSRAHVYYQRDPELGPRIVVSRKSLPAIMKEPEGA
jgi:hypothetical protein